MKDFRRLQVWTKSHELALAVYHSTATFPKSEMFGLASQMRRAAASIPSNIAEGCGRDGDGDLGRFLQIASGSASELEYQLVIARDLKYVAPEDFKSISNRVDEVSRMLTSFRQRVQAPQPPRTRAVARAAGRS